MTSKLFHLSSLSILLVTTACGTYARSERQNQTTEVPPSPNPLPVASKAPQTVQTVQTPQAPKLVQITEAPKKLLNLTLSNLKTLTGQICYSVFSEENKAYFANADAPADKITRAACVPANANPLHFAIEDLAAGTYALALFHDENSNGTMDKMGIIPKEGFAFSRNPPLSFGPPEFDISKFTYNGTSLDLELSLVRLLN